MRKFLIAGWLLLPVGAWAYHEGPGQDRIQLDAVDGELAKAKKAADAGDWVKAAEIYESALKEMPATETPELERAATRLKLSAAKAKLEGSKLIDARKELIGLIDEMDEKGSTDPADVALADEAREAYANAQYYYTWLMRLEAYPREEWEPEIEISRQQFRLLAERAEAAGDMDRAEKLKEDLESSLKLARLDLEELQGLPLPSQ